MNIGKMEKEHATGRMYTLEASASGECEDLNFY